MSLIQASKIKEAGFICDQILSWFEIENSLHEVLGNLKKHVGTRSGCKLNLLPLERPAWDNSVVFVHRTLLLL